MSQRRPRFVAVGCTHESTPSISCDVWRAAICTRAGKTPRLLEKIFRFLGFQLFFIFKVLIYEDRTQNYDP